jgi:hypothetical protein
MTTTFFHPATIELLWLQSRGRRRRMWARFCQPRRLILSTIACILAVVWLGNAAMTIGLREAAAEESLRALLSFGLALYTCWHFTKAAFFRPESPFDWSPAEQELLLAMPLRPRDLVAYQLASVTVTTLVKSGLFAILMLPDLRCLPLGFVGLVLAMMSLEIVRMGIEIATWGMSRLAFLIYRAAVVTGLVAAGFAAGTVIVRDSGLGHSLDFSEGFRQRFLEMVVQLNASALGALALPFRPLVGLILADGLTWAQAASVAAASLAVSGLAIAVIRLYAVTWQQVAAREKRDYDARGSADVTQSEPSALPIPPLTLQLPRLLWLGGAGALLWRQLLGARRHWGSLVTAMIAPAVLAGSPCFVVADPYVALLATTGALAFYTFLLLPTALRFDFRRDLDRLATLKGLPVTPAAAVIGQTLAPVLLATAFQGGVLAFAIVVRSLPPYLLLAALVVMIPINVLVFALDNLIYLLYPYRIQQEGLEIFLRTMLTFTGKGLLFALGLVVMSVWAFAAASVTGGISQLSGVSFSASGVFLGGIVAGPSLCAALVLYSLCRTYRGVDPIEDVPR